MGLLRSEQVQLWKSRLNYLRHQDCQLRHPQRGSPVLSCHVWYIPLLISAWLTTMSFLLVTAVWLYEFNHSSLVFWHYGAVVCMILPLYKLYGVCQDVRFDHALSHHPTYPQVNNCSLCSHHGIEKGHVINPPEHPVLDMAVDISVSTLFLLTQIAKCARYFLPFLLILLSGDVELNPGPPTELAVPNLSNLNILTYTTAEGGEESVRIIAALSYMWYDVGVALGQPPEQLNRYSALAQADSKKYPSCMRVFSSWLKSKDGNRRYPVTWVGVRNLLRDLGHVGLAEQLQDALSFHGIHIGDDDVVPSDSTSATSISAEPSSVAVSSKEVRGIAHHPSYHGAISGDDAEVKLKEHGGNHYLTRYSSSRNQYSLTVARNGNFKHLDIIVKKKGEGYMYRIEGTLIQRNDIFELLSYYQHHPLHDLIDGIGHPLLLNSMAPVMEPAHSLRDAHSHDEATTLSNQRSDHLLADYQDCLDNIKKHVAKRGSIKRLIAHLVFVGLPGSGKTTLIANLIKDIEGVKRILEKGSESTKVVGDVMSVDVTEDTASTQAVSIDSKWNWNKVDLDLSCWSQMGTGSFVQPKLENKGGDNERIDKLAETGEVEKKLATQAIDVNQEHGPVVQKPPTSNKDKEDKSVACDSDVEPELEMTEEQYSRVRSSLENKCTLYLSDTGGQIEFQELLPLLITGHAVYIFVFPLNCDFDKPFKVEYRRRGKDDIIQKDIEYMSTLSVKDTFLQTLSSIDSMTDSDLDSHKPYVFLIGTFKDRLKKEEAKQRISSINKSISTLLTEHKYGHLVVKANLDESEFMFVVDNTDIENTIFSTIRSRIKYFIDSDMNADSERFKIEFPLSYLLASLVLQKLPDTFIEFDVFAEKIKQYGLLDEEDIKSVLYFLHTKIGHIRYYPNAESVKNVIINQPKYLFDLVTDVVTNSFHSETSDIDEEMKKGIFAANHFKTIKSKFPKLLSPEQVLTLLSELRIAAPFYDAASDKEKIFIPCVLGHLNLRKTLQEDYSVQPLAITFACKHCPKGLFGVLIHYILTRTKESSMKWTLNTDSLFRNQVSFWVGDTKDTIILICHTSHLEVYFQPVSIDENERKKSWKAVCHVARCTLLAGAKDSIAKLHYDDKKAKPSLGFVCENIINPTKKTRCGVLNSRDAESDSYTCKSCGSSSKSRLNYWFGVKPEYDFPICNTSAEIGHDSDNLTFSVFCDPPLSEHAKHHLTRAKDCSSCDHFIEMRDGKPVVCFAKAKESDAGEYIISCSNDIGEGRKSIFLDVIGKPVYFDVTSNGYIKAKIGESHSLNFKVKYLEEKNAKHILKTVKGERVTNRFCVQDCTVTFNNLRIDDGGIYIISCSNEFGVGDCQLELEVCDDMETTHKKSIEESPERQKLLEKVAYYMKKIQDQSKLDEQIDADGVEKHIVTIAPVVDNLDYLVPALNIQGHDYRDIKDINYGGNAQRIAVLHLWKRQNGGKATYRVLLETLVGVNEGDAAETLVKCLDLEEQVNEASRRTTNVSSDTNTGSGSDASTTSCNTSIAKTISEDATMLVVHGEIVGVQMEKCLSCIQCQGNVTATSKIIGKCDKCNMRMKISKCKEHTIAKLTIEDKNQSTVNVTAFDDVISDLIEEFSGEDLCLDDKILSTSMNIFCFSASDYVLSSVSKQS